jgi:probable HAF family extracellular repeat protein
VSAFSLHLYWGTPPQTTAEGNAMNLRRFFSLITLALLAAPLLAQADPRYNVTPVAGAGSWATDINRSGQVAGTMLVSEAQHAFLFSNGMLTDIGALSSGYTVAGRMNDLGQVTGSVSGSWNGGFIYSNGSLVPVPGANIVSAAGINNAGAVTGTVFVPLPNGDAEYHAYIAAHGSFTDLGTLPGRLTSGGYDINSAGHVAGSIAMADGGPPNYPTNAMLYRNGVMTDLGAGGFMGPWSHASAINDHDQAVGMLGVDFPGNGGDLYPTLAFLYRDGMLGTLGGFGPNLSSWAGDINNVGQIVGGGYFGAVGTSHAFLYENGSMLDLNSLIDPGSGWVIEDATAINDLGQIAGKACMGGTCYAVRLDLVSAVPEPAQAAMLLAGLGLLGTALRRPARQRRG